MKGNKQGGSISEPGPELNRITEAIIGAAIEVHRILGPGFREPIYQNALAIEFAERGIPFSSQYPVKVFYKTHLVGRGRMDFLVGNQVIVELKVVEDFAPIHVAQVISYLKTTNHKPALILNFNVRVMKDGIKRIAN